MRKYIIGTIFGLVLGLSATAYADDLQTLIGQTIDGQTPVYLDGVKLDDAIIVDNKSYTPTRKVVEATGKEVTFKDGGIYLETPESTATATTLETTTPPDNEPVVETPVTPTKTLDQVNSEISRVKVQVLGFKQGIAGKEQLIKDNPDLPNIAFQKSQLEIYKTGLANAEAELAVLETQKAELEAQQQ